jgi:DNA-binding CsgD family transcriptional regulator
MLFEDAGVRDNLRRVVARFTSDPYSREEMLEECLVHIWLVETEKPGRTVSWYLQSCRFHLHHCLQLGRSVDSPKRSGAATRVPIDGMDATGQDLASQTEANLFGTVSCNDLIAAAARYLTPREKLVLKGLANGLPLRAIATSLDLSYPTALKCRRRIAAVITRLDFEGEPAAGNALGPLAQ